jgi:hypothetical protein
MKTQIALVGIGAGATSALMFASVASGSVLSIALFYVAPLPIMIAALGWSHWAAMIAALGAATTLAAVFGGMFFFAFLVGTGIPAWWLGYLTMLARPATTASTGVLEWYPPGRLVLWSAAFGALIVAIGSPVNAKSGKARAAPLSGAANRSAAAKPPPTPMRMT